MVTRFAQRLAGWEGRIPTPCVLVLDIVYLILKTRFSDWE